MGKQYITSLNGAVGTFAEFNADFQGFSIVSSQAFDETTPFGTDKWAKHLGGGTLKLDMDAAGFAFKGTGTATNYVTPFDSMTPAGGTSTFTLDTGVVMSTDVIVYRVSLGVSRLRAGCPVSFSMTKGPAVGIATNNTNSVTITWPTTS